MGLDLYAISNLKPVGTLGEWLEEHPGEYPEDLDHFVMPKSSYEHQEQTFPGRADGIEPDMVYEFDPYGAEDFSMGSYGTYNGFRRTVAQFASDSGAYGQFEPVCNFSDCDGEIGAAVAGELADTFAQSRDGYESFLEKEGADREQIDYLLMYYDNMTEAFQIARDNGVVIFC